MWRQRLGDGQRCHVALSPWYRFTGKGDGDLAPGSTGIDGRRQAVATGPWTWLCQVHGAAVVVVDGPGDHAGVRADAAVTAVPGAILAVTVADCAPVALLAEDAVGVVHAGWRGLRAGVVQAAVDALRRLGAGPLEAVIGPCIRPRCYEFNDPELAWVARELGEGVVAKTADGRPALDVAAAVRLALAAEGVHDWIDTGVCTACSPVHWSHRRDGDHRRQALVAALAP